MADFSFVAEALKRADEFMRKAPAIFPRLCAYHKCRLVITKDYRATYQGWRDSYIARLISTNDGHEMLNHVYYDEPSNERVIAEMLKEYLDYGSELTDPEFRANAIKFDSIEELDLQLSVRGY